MNRKALVLVLAAVAVGGATFAFTFDPQERRQERRERDVRRERSERPRVHPLGMALEMQKKLGLREEQVKEFEDMWAEYREIRQRNSARLQELEREMAGLRREFSNFEEELAGHVYESLGPDQREMLRDQMREINQRFERERRRERDVRREREGGQERELRGAVERIRAAVEAGEMTREQAEERISALRRRMGGGEQRRPRNPIGQHPMAYALEGARKIGLDERQVKGLQEAWSEIRSAGAEIGGQMRELERHAAELREAGEWNDRTAQEVNAHGQELRAHLEELHAHASEILDDTLNNEQVYALEELMAASRDRGREGERRRGPANPMHGHSMAWALEMHEKLGLNERQIATLREAYGDLRRKGDELNERQMGLQRRKAAMQEGGRWTDRTAVELNNAMKEIGMAREEIQAKASEIVADTLNKEQLAQLKKTIAERRRDDG